LFGGLIYLLYICNIQLLGMCDPEFTLADYPLMDDRLSTCTQCTKK